MENAETFGNLHLSDRLPFIHRHKPCSILPPTTQINHKSISIISQRCEDLLQTRKREATQWEQERSNDDLLSMHCQ